MNRLPIPKSKSITVKKCLEMILEGWHKNRCYQVMGIKSEVMFGMLICLGSFINDCSGQVLEREKIDSSQVNVFVLQAYNEMFNKVDAVEWYKVGGLSYEAHFTLNDKNYRAFTMLMEK